MKPSLVIIGLGNPGKSYERTRHNIGFQAVDVLHEQFGQGEWKDAKKFVSRIAEGRVVTAPVLFVKPNTYMNNSGEAVRRIVEFYKLNPAEQVLVIFDEIDLTLGEVRLRMKGSGGTHNGMKSIVEQYGEAVPRLRIGLGKPLHGEDLATWILSSLSPEEQQGLDDAYQELPTLVREFVMGEDQPKKESL